MKKLMLLTFLASFTLFAENKWHYYHQYFNYSSRHNHPIGIMVTAYNRPDMFKATLTSLEKTPEAQTLPFFFILDGGPKARQKEHIILITNSTISNKHIIIRNSNYGNGRNVIDARRFMFEWCGFTRIVVFEDDIVINPEYITLTLNFHKWATTTYDNIGVVSCYNDCFLSKKDKEKKLDIVEETLDKYWGYCIDKNTYNQIKNTIDEYEKTCLIDIPRHQSNGPTIAEWMLKHLNKPTSILPANRSFPSIINYDYFFQEKVNSRYTEHRRDGQDIEVRLALFKAGKIKLSTTVNRAMYIGLEGTHHHNSKWKRNEIHHILLDRFPQDSRQITFTTVYNQPHRLRILFILKELPRQRHDAPISQIRYFIEQGHQVFILTKTDTLITRSIINSPPKNLQIYNLKNNIFHGHLPSPHDKFDIIYTECEETASMGLQCKKNNLKSKLALLFPETSKIMHKDSSLSQELVHYVDLFITPSLSDKEKLIEKGFDHTKITILYPNITSSSLLFKERIPKSSKRLTLVTTSDLFTHKNTRFTLETLLIILKQIPSLSIKIISDQASYYYLYNLVMESNLSSTVTIIKEENETHAIAEILDSAHLFLYFPPHPDHIHKTAITAMALGLPIITIPHNAVSELIEHEKSGIFISRYDYHAIITALYHLIQNPEKIGKIGRVGRKKIERAFNTHAFNNNLERLFLNSLSKR